MSVIMQIDGFWRAEKFCAAEFMLENLGIGITVASKNNKMNNKILVGNLATAVTEHQIKELFSTTVGTVLSVDLPKDPRTGTNRGYAFVEMGSSSEAADAVTNLNGHDVSGRRLNLTLTEQPGQKQKSDRKWYQFGSK
ncbi:MAG: RNA-binding protein [Candidatus Obscuribacterales bacterium]